MLTFRDRTAVWARISVFVQTGHGVHPAPYTMGSEPFPGVNRPRSGVFHSPPPNTEVKERVELYICFPSGPSWSVIGRTCVLRVPELLTCYHNTDENYFMSLGLRRVVACIQEQNFKRDTYIYRGSAVTQLVEALHYNQKGLCFDCRRGL